MSDSNTYNILARGLSFALDEAKGVRNKARAAWVVVAEWEDVRGPHGTNAERAALGDLEDTLQYAADDVEPDSDYEYARAEAVADAARKWVRKYL